MNSYLQKIANRSGDLKSGELSSSAVALPDLPSPFEAEPKSPEINFPKDPNDIVDNGKHSETRVHSGPQEIIPAKLIKAESDNIIKPIENRNPISRTNADHPTIPVDKANNRKINEETILRPALTAIEKITLRTEYQKIIEKTTEKDASTTPLKEKTVLPILPQQQELSDKLKYINGSKSPAPEKRNIMAAKNSDVTTRPAQLLPVHHAEPVASQKENNTEKKLVIGRITVQVIREVQPVAKTKEPISQQPSTNTAVNSGFISNNKLSFGLSQL